MTKLLSGISISLTILLGVFTCAILSGCVTWGDEKNGGSLDLIGDSLDITNNVIDITGSVVDDVKKGE